MYVDRKMSGPQCCENPPVLSSVSGLGSVDYVGGLKSYVSGSSSSKLAVVLISDIFGYEAPKLRNIADKIAKAGFYVVVPDFLKGDPYDPTNAARALPVWIKDHGTDKGFEDAKIVIADLKSKGIESIGAAGFCWGAKVVVELSNYPYIQAAVLLHPSFVSVEDIEGVKVPISVLGAENDQMSPVELVNKFGEVLKAKQEVPYLIKIFPGVSHGWSVKYDDNNPKAVESAEESHQDLIDWVVKYIK
ncbi:endo-1,3;1,4-beta-D-glucanase-like [Impatiens glandulifera]|uniref:endo-1,3;1,4-beta-D-glucanase-like n=1 Tax=Impatiens glandulifera TaxID=253017 RepID=UPI001FB088F5|nr:endo-1,3;1,4-beta-D-glucanase-like [Impatiens glandulifera]